VKRRPIDVKTLVGETSLEVLNRAAEEYFASLRNWDDHLASRFGAIVETPRLLVNLSTVCTVCGCTCDAVLDFGAGTGWLARALTQLAAASCPRRVGDGADIATDCTAGCPSSATGRARVPCNSTVGRFRFRTAASIASSASTRSITRPTLRHDPAVSRALSWRIAAFSEQARGILGRRCRSSDRTYRVVENDMTCTPLWRTPRNRLSPTSSWPC